MSTKTRQTRMLLVLFTTLCMQQILAFNFDTNVPIVKEGQANSFFGFSIAQHIKGAGTNEPV